MLRRSAFLLVLPLLLTPASAKDKKPILPEIILQARYVNVMVDPDSGISVTNPAENGTAQSDVERALEKWGRFKVTTESLNADLIFVVRKGGAPVKGTIGVPPTNRPVVANPGGTDDINVGVRVGTPPPPRTDTTQIDSPAPRTEVSSAEDLLEIYRGGDVHPLDSAPLWHYLARNALQHPSVPAIEKLRKAIEEAEKSKP